MSDYIHLSIITNCGFEFRSASAAETHAEAEAGGGWAEGHLKAQDPGGSSHDSSISAVTVTGPARACDFFEQQGGTGSSLSWLSPKALVTVPKKFRKGAGIPLKAKSFAFVYPTRSLELQDALNQLDLQREAWAFTMLIGGFAYFDPDDALLGVNAITFSADSTSALMLIGPSSCTQHAFASIIGQGRLRSMPQSLRTDGFELSGWVHPNELIDGELLTKSGAVDGDYPHGAMLYSGAPADGSVPSAEDALVYTMLVPGDPRYVKPGKGRGDGELKSTKTQQLTQQALSQVRSGTQKLGTPTRSSAAAGGRTLSKAVGELKKRSSDAYTAKQDVSAGFVGRVEPPHPRLRLRRTIRKVLMKAVRAAAFIGVGLYVFTRPCPCMEWFGSDSSDDWPPLMLSSFKTDSNWTTSASKDIDGNWTDDDDSAERRLSSDASGGVLMCYMDAADALYFIMVTISTVGCASAGASIRRHTSGTPIPSSLPRPATPSLPSCLLTQRSVGPTHARRRW